MYVTMPTRYDMPDGGYVMLTGGFKWNVITCFDKRGDVIGEVAALSSGPAVVRKGSVWFSRENALAYMEKHFGHQEHEGWNDHE